MPPTDHQSSFLNRISIRRNQVSTMENNHDQELEDIELFQKHVADRLAELASSGDESNVFLSIAWFRSLLDAFLCCEAEFKAVLIIDRDPTQFIKPPLDRVSAELQDRCVKALDICNAITYAIDMVHYWQKLAEIVVTSLEERPIGDGQVARAKKVLNALLVLITEDYKEQKTTERSWSFGRRGSGASVSKDQSSKNFRYLNMCFAKSWSSAKEIQAMASNLVEPRGKEANGLAMPVYVMSSVMVFSMWALVAAFPCQERNGLPTHFPVAKNLNWTQSLISLQASIIGEEWKKKEKKGKGGLLDELQKMEKVVTSLIEFTEAFKFPAEEEKVKEVEAQVAELSDICKRMGESLGPLQQQVREIFHRLVRSRGELMDLVEQAGFITAASN
ncbi:hypothetical protein DCAR_0105000 [Daucus carota subsp. sativus]|uniref:Uncharacterized protein n=1 Tax=Daucus carota subsp. sativus TaxID=79200 RepID=A0AAF0W9J2_DAUCS|nr:hypothetical protein DCAR_0105000 [Daucus carota subsp. sativus]